ncbi:NAD(P)-dependent oxidoreductase [Marinobacter vulgaris]|uniref:NAD(P)-dependent oxidoreductase n=1 Tax=Marinobacter vulgaris TaxID=1928331 RepID=A0A2V3ZP01_9GAMM|nr:SDR family oxidoreductase [Marinobacter vulgaris]PXX92653.1 NAD(P)-dependent oxidoreductase [Marinobacter vulgaris]TSJ71403.1 SDR family oxidoreductase [Marinobacter vulgaris]
MWTLITGAGSGIGRALALELSNQGHDLILSGRTVSKLEDVAGEVSKHSPQCKVITLIADFSDPTSTRNLANQVRNAVDQLSAFVYCAGVGEPAADFASLDLIDFQEALAVNVSAPMLLTQSLLPVLTGHDPAARIVMIGAGMDTQAQPGTGSYGVSKMALRRLVQQLSVEFGTMPQGPVISLFQPGLVDTPGIRHHVDKAAGLGLPHAQWLRDRLDNGECLTAEQAASALAFTLSQQTPESDFQGAVYNGRDLVDSLSFAGS